jgi:AcrR family transcriptional regulator
MDEVAQASGVAKGAIYHHFRSKEALFRHVLETVQQELAALHAAKLPASAAPLDHIMAAVLQYLIESSHPLRRRILLIDGPAVIGWQAWREIDYRFFGAGARAGVEMLLAKNATPTRVTAVTHLLMGAVTEAALVCATHEDPKRQARDICHALRMMLSGLVD